MIKSNSEQPDLDWSQVSETVKLLLVTVAQVETSMGEGDKSVNALTESFTSLVTHNEAVENLLTQLDTSPEIEAALLHCNEVSEKTQAAIVAFQFYDRLQQSLAHVTEGLTGLSELLKEPARLYNPFEWQKFQREIRANYTMESERVMFDAILQGKSIEEAIQLVEQSQQSEKDNSIELF